jgi:hypothetical protein
MEVTCSSESSVDFQQTTRRYIPEERTPHNHRGENLKSYNSGIVMSYIQRSRAPNRRTDNCKKDGNVINCATQYKL